MTSIKKVVAIVLAFLMIFSSVSVLASADVSDFDGGKALNIETKFFKDGEPVERVKPGDEVKARVYVGTDYYSNDSTLLFFYDKDFFTHSYSTGAAVESNNSGVTGYLNPNPDLSSQTYLTSEYLEQYGAFLVNLEVASINNVMYDASDWLFEVTLKVLDTAGSTAEDIIGDFFVNPATIQNTTDGVDAVISVPKGPSTGTDADLWPMWLWDADVTLNSTPVTSESSVTFNANGGSFDEAGEITTQSYTGTIETDNVPVQAQPIRAGYTFLGWDDTSDDTVTEGAQPEKFLLNDVTLNAVWVKNVDITFETYEGTEIPALTDKTPGTDFPEIADPEKEGYTFRGWEPALPDVYPTESTEYRAIWKLNVTMSFDTLGGTEIADRKGYSTQEFDPASVPAPSKTGYTFRGWSPALPDEYPAEDTTYTAIYEQKLYTAKYYIVENGVPVLKRAARIEYDGEISTDIINDLIPEGYVLNGWYTDEACQNKLAEGAKMSDQPISLYATFEIEAYDAIFEANGGYFDGDESHTNKVVNTEFEAEIEAPADPVREGYVFKGWTPAVGIMDTVGGKTFYATWELEENAVVYLWNNADAPNGAANYEVFNVAFNESVDIPADPSIKGYTFKFWGATADATEAVEIPAAMPADGLEYYAIWDINSYDVTFDANKGYLDGDTLKLTQTENLEFKSAITAPVATRAGYDFAGWALKADATADDVIAIEATVPANDLYYYAVWTPAEAAYKVEYYMQGLDGNYVIDSDRTVETKGATEGTVTAPELTGLDGMFTLNELHDEAVPSAIVLGDGSTVLKLYYSRDKHTYTFTNTGDTNVADITLYYGETVTAPDAPSWVGHTWKGWNATIPGTMGTADATFEGTWDVNVYTVTFYANNGYLNGDKATTEKIENIAFGNAIIAPEASRDGYKFEGWATKADATAADVVALPDKMGDEKNGLTYYAVWTPNTNTAYKVEYYMQDLNGDYVLDADRNLSLTGTTATDVTAPALTDVDGMFSLNNTMGNLADVINGDGSTVLKAYYDRAKYTYTFTNTGDNAVADITLFYGAAVTEPVPTKEGSQWKGWTPAVPEVMGTSNMTFTGNWELLKYTATFHANAADAYIGTEGTESRDVETFYGNPINAPKATRPGYTFKGWATTATGEAEALPSTMPAKTLEYYAVWEAADGITYWVEYYVQNTQGEYVYDSRSYQLSGVTGDTVTAEPLTDIEGKFTLNADHEESNLSDVINGDGSTVLKAYYSREQYTFKAYVDGAEVENQTYYYDAIIAKPADPEKTGYSWDGKWYSDDACTTETSIANKMPANDVTVYAKFVANDVMITVVVNYVDQTTGNPATAAVNSYSGKSDSIIQLVDVIPEPKAENTTYILVNDLPDADMTLIGELRHYQYDAEDATNLAFNATNTKVNADGSTIINVNYAPVEYTIKYINEGAEALSQKLTYYSDLVLPAEDPSKPGYTFLGWYLGEDKAEVTDKVTGDKTYTAKYEEIPYTVTYVYAGDVPAGETAPEAVTTHIGVTVDKPAITPVPGYTVTDWVLAGDVDGKVYTSDVTATATWAYIDYTIDYTVTGDIPEGYTAPTDITNAHIGDTVVADIPDAVPGHTFSGWTIEGDVNGKVGTENVTVTGSWAYIPYDIIYVYEGDIPAGETAPEAVTTHIGVTVDKPAITPVPGYTVTDWVLAGDVDGKVYTSDVTATATWAYIDYTIDYTVDGDIPEGYTAPADITNAHIGDTVVADIPDEVPGYTFSGWTIDGDVNGKVGTENVTVTGSWAYIPYTIRYEHAGDVPETVEKLESVTTHIGATVSKPTYAAVPGYNLVETVIVGAVNDKVGTEDITITTTWEYIDYTIDYTVDGDIPEGYTAPTDITNAHIGDKVIADIPDEVPGYTFSGWTIEGDVNGEVYTSNVTVTGSWAYIPYTVTYKYAGDVPAGETAPEAVTTHIGVTVDKPTITPVPGYTVTDWVLAGDVDGKVGTENVTATATWAYIDYTIDYTVDGDIPEGYTAPADITNAHIGDTVVATEPTAIEGFTFSGWTIEGDVNGKVGTQNITVTGSWTRNSHKVIFNANGGSAVAEATYSYDAIINAPEATTRYGFEFVHWYEAGSEDTAFAFGTAKMPDKDVTLFAKWKANGHTITFNSNGGSNVDQISTTFGSTVEAPTAPERAGYTFAYWYEGEETEEFGFPYKMEDRDVVLTAKWNPIPVTVDYVFTGNIPSAAKEPTDVIVKIDDTVVLPAVNNIHGYIFEGWTVTGAVDNGDGTYKAGEETKITVTGKWKYDQFTVTFDAKNGTELTTVTQNFNTIVNEPYPAPEKTGYTFDKWVIKGTSEEYDFLSLLTDDVELEATWIPVLYTITFNSNGGTPVDKIEAYYQDDISAKLPLNENMVKTGYEFQGWLKDGKDYTLPTSMPAENIKVDANWVAAGNTIYTMKVFLMDTTGVYVEAKDEQTTGSGTTLGNAEFNAPETREGFTLNKAMSKLTGVISADGSLELYAYYTRNQHAVTFSNTYDTDYAGDSAGTYYFGSMISAPSNNPNREGYTFEGWYTDIEDASTKLVPGETLVPDSAVTYVANWTVNPYTITYVSDGDQDTVPAQATFKFDTETAEPSVVPTKTGYTFAYWYETDLNTPFVFGEKMPAKNITLTAAWTANDVVVTYVFEGDVPADAVLPAEIKDAHINDVIDLTAPAGIYGYTFNGWSVSGAEKNDEGNYTVDTRAVTVTGNWTINQYTVTFDSKGGTGIEPVTQNYKTVVAKPAPDPELKGHTFKGWVIAGTSNAYDFAAELVADVALEATWDRNTYTITYVSGEGATQIPEASYLYEATTAAPTEPKKLGYTFDYWYETDENTEFVFGGKMPDRNITLNAKWTANNVKITYTFTGNVPDEAVLPAEITNANIGNIVNLAEPAAVAGYKFNGWTVAGAEKNEEGNYVVDTRAVIVTGNWTINSYAVKFADYNDAVLAEGTFVYKSVIAIKPADPTREGYEFLGWYATIGDAEVEFADGDKVPAQDVTYVAKYQIKSYDLIFTANGTELFNDKVEYGKELASYIPDSTSIPAKEGYRFAGWALAENAGTAVAVAAKMPANTLSYVAVYEANIYNVYYYVKVIDGNDATEDTFKLVSTARTEYGDIISTNANYTSPEEGYEFKGWYKDEEMTVALGANETMSTGKLSLYATETAIEYSAIFDANGGAFADASTSQTVPTFYEQEIVAPAAPERKGYNFVGWTPAVAIMDAQGKTFKAQWEAIEGAYTVTYYVDGEEYEQFAIAAGESIDVPADPDKMGYEFLGWAPASVADPTEADIVADLAQQKMPTENLEYNAVFNAVSAYATFYKYKNSDHGPAGNPDIGYDEYDKKSYIFGDTIVIPENPVLYNTAGVPIDDYYTFLHWIDDDGNTYPEYAEIIMPSEAINFYPVYERISVKLMPAEGTTAMIDRYVNGGSIVESYNDGYGISTEAYTHDGDFTRWYIYGLADRFRENNLAKYIEVQGDGYYEVEYSELSDRFGTGAKVLVYDNLDPSEPVEEFYIIIFGDINGDGRITSNDVTELVEELASPTWSRRDAVPYRCKAANLDGNTRVTSNDTTVLKSVIAGETLNQITATLG